jgi:hypothetical protein
MFTVATNTTPGGFRVLEKSKNAVKIRTVKRQQVVMPPDFGG